MSLVPDQLYRPSPKDLTAMFAPIALRRSLASSAAAASVSLQSDAAGAGGFPIPRDMVFVCRTVQVGGSGGGAQTCSRVTVDVNDDNSNTLMRLIDHNPTAATTIAEASLVECVVFGGEVLLASAFFSAGAVANAIRLSFCGILIPRANWQRN